jgi:hypothetical protein
LVGELLGSNVDMIVTTSAVATLAASAASGSIANVQRGRGSPVRSGDAGALPPLETPIFRVFAIAA